jgi:hypothetical protein
MALSLHSIRHGLAVPFFLIVSIGAATAANEVSIAGNYTCDWGCRVTDAAPSIEIQGNVASCTNELGGLFVGRALTKKSVSCFNKVGRLSDDGNIIRWDDGVIWKRWSAPFDPHRH